MIFILFELLNKKWIKIIIIRIDTKTKSLVIKSSIIINIQN